MPPTRATPATAEHPADRAVRMRDRAALPDDQRAAYDAVQSSFVRYEARDDDGAREALQAIGLQSPFIDWKLLIRGLIAYTNRDDARALENWQRLDPVRLPARLAAPLQAAIDPTFAKSHPELRKVTGELASDEFLDAVNSLRRDLSRDKPLSGAFRKIEPLVPRARDRAPTVVAKLANCFYRAILSHGEPGDLVRFRKTFGPPPDDPAFHRLEAMVYEAGGNDEQSAKHWAAYEAWLATNPPGWPAAIATRARAMIFHRLALFAIEAEENPDGDMRDAFAALFGGPRHRVRKPKTDPLVFLRKAMEAAPDWDTPALSLFDRLVEREQNEEAEKVARRLLERRSTSLPMMDGLSALLARTGRAAEALELRTKALATNPLDRKLRVQAAYAYLGAGRRLAIDGQVAEAEAILVSGESLCSEHTPVGYYSLRSVIARKLKHLAEADEFRSKAESGPGGRLAAALFASVDSALLKLKPAERKPADAALTAALAGPAAPLEANLLYAAWDQYFLEGITYRGQKTQEKKIQDVILRTPASDGSMFDFENLALAIEYRNEWKLTAKLAAALRTKFPSSPVFPLQQAEAEFEKANGYPAPYRVSGLLKTAEQLAQRSQDPRHRQLLDRIRELQDLIGRVPDIADLFAEIG